MPSQAREVEISLYQSMLYAKLMQSACAVMQIACSGDFKASVILYAEPL
jgi:hypothetical protein